MIEETNRVSPIIGAVEIVNGERGSDIIDDTTSHAGPYRILEVLEDAVFHADSETAGNMNGLAGPTFAEGKRLFGVWASIKLTSGAVIAYK